MSIQYNQRVLHIYSNKGGEYHANKHIRQAEFKRQ
jgi:hypothetical protein